MTKRRYIINMVVTVVLAVVSGYFIGSYIAGSRLVSLSNSYNELVLRGSSDASLNVPTYFSDVANVYYDQALATTGTKTPDKINAIDAFMLA